VNPFLHVDHDDPSLARVPRGAARSGPRWKMCPVRSAVLGAQEGSSADVLTGTFRALGRPCGGPLRRSRREKDPGLRTAREKTGQELEEILAVR
jgi:hypothetical protein